MRKCFGAGPAKQNQKLLDKLAEEIRRNPSVLEMSHRSHEFQQILNHAKQTLKKLLEVPDEMDILFLSGGASFQFIMCAENLLHQKAGYLITGLFAKLAYEAAIKTGECDVLYDNTDHPYDLSDFPKRIDGNYDYVYVCLNNSLYGTKTPEFECECPIVADASSILGIEPIDFSKYILVFASAQKNFGISGMSIVFVRKSVKLKENLNPLISYQKQMEADSLLNTPPILAIVMCGLCAEELLKRKKTLYQENRAKAERMYEYLDQSTAFVPMVNQHRSLMNIVFQMKSEQEEERVLKELKKASLDGMKGHRLTGHLRASFNVFVSCHDVQVLIDALKEIEKTGE